MRKLSIFVTLFFFMFLVKTINAQSQPILSISLGANSPKDHVWDLYTNGSQDNLMLKINMTATGAEDIKINTIYIKANGSGNDKTGIKYVRLVWDVDNDGTFGPYDDILGLSKFESDDWYTSFKLNDFVLKVNSTVYVSIFYIMSNESYNGSTFSFRIEYIDAIGVESKTYAKLNGLPINSAVKTIITRYVENVTNVSSTNVTIPTNISNQTSKPEASKDRKGALQTAYKYATEIDKRIIGIALLTPLIVFVILFSRKKLKMPKKVEYGKHPLRQSFPDCHLTLTTIISCFSILLLMFGHK